MSDRLTGNCFFLPPFNFSAVRSWAGGGWGEPVKHKTGLYIKCGKILV